MCFLDLYLKTFFLHSSTQIIPQSIQFAQALISAT
jgi:hypothetical protein